MTHWFAMTRVGVCLGFLGVSSWSFAQEKKTKVIDFESSVVEGINRRPYDSLNQLSDAEKRRKKSHLYRKRSGFSTDTRETLSEMRLAQ